MSKINDYARFVDSCTSNASKHTDTMISRVEKLQGTVSVQGTEREEEMQVARLLTSVIGMMAESGEFAEVVKKKIFQADTQFTNDEIFHMKRELGDVLWYWVQGCIALGFTPDEVMDENIKKLESRYPNGFEVIRSEVRKEGDI
ncbi:nucleoside triphosphate pyrophosphohydrolase family protein [Gammaproteobacteria bacterium]|jgi:NTP pyrophosphatase (non-canonical NTP hydrolase)|nr:nucleoside triphosphate pyrophosphohydrolase family protein [Gammaproteobacteria bacterium]